MLRGFRVLVFPDFGADTAISVRFLFLRWGLVNLKRAVQPQKAHKAHYHEDDYAFCVKRLMLLCEFCDLCGQLP
ncbi:MAG: hypothetical protein A2X58_13060 [Nitrospirae bacterium GWC2_56_14]|nr:MAG: hypothetical protein A2X58_13060 [Nitrospirae bacterium GWC2_56_14]